MDPQIQAFLIVSIGVLGLSTLISWRLSISIKKKIHRDTVELLATDRAAKYFDSGRPWPEDRTHDDSDEHECYNDGVPSETHQRIKASADTH